MALIKCPECEKEISDKAVSCPYCGVPILQGQDSCLQEKGPLDTTVQNKNTSTWGIVGIVLGGASLIMPYFASVFLVPAGFLCGVISYRKKSKKLGVIRMTLSFLGLCWIIYVSIRINEIIADPFSNHSILPTMSAEAPVVTIEKFNKIKDGMAYWEVRSIIGTDGEKLSESVFSGITTVMYSWSNSNGSNMNAMFQDGKLINKAQFGLR